MRQVPAELLPAAAPGLRAGTASLLGHLHDEKLWSLRSFVSVGTVEPVTPGSPEAGWVFSPERYPPGASPDPSPLLRTVRAARRTTKRCLEARGLRWPVAAWDAFKALYDRPDLAG